MDPEDIDKFEDADGCPEPDNDGDGLADKIDQCSNDAEDKDNFEDDDGCPDPDNDNDTFLDKDDKCPLEFGVAPDGCPKKYTNVVVTKTKIEIKQTIFFEFNKATIKSVSFGLLNEVAQAMKDNPTIKVEIQVHTDSVGNDKFNLKLSQKRAESVKAYLVKRRGHVRGGHAVGRELRGIEDDRDDLGRGACDVHVGHTGHARDRLSAEHRHAGVARGKRRKTSSIGS